MITRKTRSPHIGLSILTACIASALLLALLHSCSPDEIRTDPASYVDPTIGTGGHGHTYPGASMPFGMVQLSPDTRLTGWDGCSAYHYSDDVVYGFSHTHLSGTGCSDYGDILVMATTGEPLLERGSAGDPSSGYASRFSHEHEESAPGYYSLILEDYGILAEMTVTPRAGFHRYVFPAADSANIVIDLLHRDRVIDSSLRITGDSSLEGHRRSSAWAADQHVYFAIEFSKPFRESHLAVGGEVVEGAGSVSGENVKGCFTFHANRHEAILVRVGISAVDIEGARGNLEAEIPHWDFDEVRIAARRSWNEALGRIRIEGGTDEQRTTFYTALYHSMLAPNLYQDVDGRYRGRDLEIHVAEGFTNYTVFSLWDTYRALHPLLNLLDRERTVDFIRTFLVQYEQGGALPVWELAANETGTMIGYHAVPVIVDAWVKGIRDFDADRALEAMVHSADLDHLGLSAYKRLGFIPADSAGSSVSRTIEYAFDDWCIAVMANELGEEETYRRFTERAQAYKHLYDPSTGFMRPRTNGGWLTPFDPAEVNFHYTEANAWQYSFYVPQDIEGLIAMMGGRDRFASRLDSLFTAPEEISGLDQPDVSGLIGQYAHGNEPSHHMAYLYNYAGVPWKTQEKVRQIMHTLYSAAPEGLCGNEDCGQMSAWYVFSAIGFYPVTPGSEIYAIGSPLFDRVEIDIDGGGTFVVEKDGAGPYIGSASLNGKDWTRSWLSHSDIVRGGELELEMELVPSMRWGSGLGDTPPSAITESLIVPAPWIDPSPRSFTDSLVVTMGTADPYSFVRYTADGSEPHGGSDIYVEPLLVTGSVVLKAFTDGERRGRSAVVTSRMNRIPGNIDIELENAYSSMYTAGGRLALVDGARGGDDFRTGAWQGYQGVDIVAVVDLGDLRRIRRVSAGFIQEQRSWIFMPESIEYSVSADGDSFETVARLGHEIPLDLEGSVTREFTAAGLDARARYVRVTARNTGTCPEWHPGAGHPAWIFADEIIIE